MYTYKSCSSGLFSQGTRTPAPGTSEPVALALCIAEGTADATVRANLELIVC
jgi:hypothetical protein